ncbi:50S ribosomal protein L13 [Mesoplasma lactucae]|uniref:Large ribosomal subunit protein uL13 n=1 Tax=Mesoplasma lactucae ATCC 49193 TaxID=81460 RepID=A0A291IR56_9MOLU|nr:50S ribosomal protein L13 [Mesoplasma lactucae]ATG97206.1 50S ribosomal protein L13 [Mesoplasma lactucae ATCC 49193]ATZ20352.1 50S ribosomal protein L13 [Mesoplasma lactucae ATCC 49193]MCL8216523.1 50S ribosomal protein L13 [Mesoplasma lactucae ATCC 49193]
MKQTTLIKASDIKKDWWIVDAEGQTVGRLATQVAMVLRGKHKPTFTPHINNGDHVIIINADKVAFTGKKEQGKNYYHHSMYPGGLKRRNVATVRERKPEFILENAVRLMLPKGVQGHNQFRALHVFAGTEHPYAAQQPKQLVVNTTKKKSLKEGGQE